MLKKREEKLDQILDQMRESSSEKDLKRLLSNVSLQLDAIKRGYHSFRDAQLELIAKYPEMVDEELSRYRESVRSYFFRGQLDTDLTAEAAMLDSDTSDMFKQVFSERVNSEHESKIVEKTTKGQVTLVVNDDAARADKDGELSNPEDIIESALEAPSSGFRPELLDRVQTESYLKNCFIHASLFNDIRNMYVSFRRFFRFLLIYS